MFSLPQRLSFPCRPKAGTSSKSGSVSVSPQSGPQASTCGCLSRKRTEEGTALSNQSRRREERPRKKNTGLEDPWELGVRKKTQSQQHLEQSCL